MYTTELFTIDGQPMPVPDGDMALHIADIEASDSGLDESGVRHCFLLRQGVKSWDFSYARLDRDAYGYLESLFAGKETFLFGYPSEMDGARQEITAYRSKCSVLWHSAGDGLFRNCKFRITAC